MLHSRARALLDVLEQRGIPATQSLTPAEARQAYLDRRSLTQPSPPQVAAVESLHAEGPHGSIPLRLYRPLTEADSAVNLCAAELRRALKSQAPDRRPGSPQFHNERHRRIN
jgi:hypothetical protein